MGFLSLHPKTFRTVTYDFDTCPDRRGTGSLKWERYAGRDVLPMWVADMDFLSPPEVLEALRARAAHGVFGYTVPPRSTVEAVRQYLSRTHGHDVPGDGIVWFPGLVPALNIACATFCEDGDEVLTCTPVYPPFLLAPRFRNRTVRTVDLVIDQGEWTIDFDALERTVSPRTRLFILCNPHNPVGRVFPRATLERLAEFCRRHRLVLCSDEIHCDLILDAIPHVSGLSLADAEGPGIIALFAPSKTYNLAGLACAFAVVPDPALRTRLQRGARGFVTEINAFGYAGCEAAFRHGEPWRQALLDVLRSHRDHLRRAAAGWRGVSLRPPQATYLAWLDARNLGVANPAEFFEQHGVGLSDGVPFGAPPGFLRLNFGCPRAQFDEALRRMARAIDSQAATTA